MPKARSPNRDKAKQMWQDSGKKILLKDIAKALDVSEEQVRKWKCQDKWEKEDEVTLPKNKSNVTKKDKGTKKSRQYDEDELEENDEFTEKQRLFCLYYVKYFNASKAALKAGYSKESCRAIGCENLTKPNIIAEIKRLKGNIKERLLLEAQDILQVYIDIAFADITDYVSFGQREIQLTNDLGLPIYGNGKEPITRKVNYVDFKDSIDVDGSIISEVKQGREGVSIKLHDKMRALEKLEKYFDLLPDQHKRRIEEEKLKLDKERLELEKKKANGEGGDDELVNDWMAGVMEDE